MGIIKSELDRDKDLLIRHATGEISAEDIKDAIQSYYSDASAPIASKVLWDLREVTFNQISSWDVGEIGRFAAKHTGPRKGGKTALLFSSEVGFGLGRMFDLSSFAKPASLRVPQHCVNGSGMELVYWLSGAPPFRP